MAEQHQTNAIQISNYDKIRAMARNKTTIDRFVEMLGSKSNAMAYISSAMLAVANSDQLMECAPASVFNSVMRAAALRLSCDPALKQAHIVPFYNNKKGRREAQLIPGYIGLNQLAQRTGKYRFLQTSELWEGQIIEVNQLTGEPQLHGRRSGDTVLGYFHYFELFNGFKHILYMTVDQLRAHGEQYAAKNPMWKSNFPAMCKKTVTRLHLLKDGLLDPFDRSILQEASEETAGSDVMGETIDGAFTEQDEAIAAQEAAVQKAEPPKHTAAENLSALGFDPETGEVTPKKAEPETPKTPEKPAGTAQDAKDAIKETAAKLSGKPQESKPAPAVRPYDPETLKAKLTARATAFAGKKANGNRNQVAACLNHVLGGDGSRKELQVFLFGQASLSDVSDELVLAAHEWLKPAYDQNQGVFLADEIAAKEANTAHVYSQKNNGQQELPIP
jgi:recombination protein RecT